MNLFEKILNQLFPVDHVPSTGVNLYRHDYGSERSKPKGGLNRNTAMLFRFPSQSARILLSVNNFRKQKPIRLIVDPNHSVK